MITSALTPIILDAVQTSRDGMYYSALLRIAKEAGFTPRDCRAKVDMLLRMGRLKQCAEGSQALVMTLQQARRAGVVV